MAETIHGYTYGTEQVAKSPVSLEDLALLKAATMFTDEDERYLRMAGEVLADQIDEILDLWYGWVGSHPHLVYYFSGPDGQPDPRYLQAVRGTRIWCITSADLTVSLTLVTFKRCGQGSFGVLLQRT